MSPPCLPLLILTLKVVKISVEGQLMISSQVILYEMLVGQPPFLANTPAETQYKVGVILLDFVDDVIFILFTFS